MSSSFLLSCNHNTTNHASFHVPWHQTSKLKFARPVECPMNLTRLTWHDVGHKGFIMLHVWKAFHQLRMISQVFGCAHHKFMQNRALVVNHESNGLARLDMDQLGAEDHVVRHMDLNGAVSLGFTSSKMR